MKNAKLRKLTLCAVMIALSTVLSMVKVIQMPFGGSVTLLSMLPVCFISLYFGVGTGMVTAFAYSLIQLLLDLPAAMSWGMTPTMWVGSILFDYIIAFSVLGLAGLFRKKGLPGAGLGVVLVCVLRFISHFISGSIFFAIWMPEEFSSPFVYSLVYNGAYMLPEMIVTAIGAVLVFGAVMRLSKNKN